MRLSHQKWRLDFLYQTLGSAIICLISTSANRFFLQPVGNVEIGNLINNLDTHKATSPDDIPVLVLKNCKLVIAPWLAKLINECFVLGVFPDILKMARVTPLFKSGDKSLCNNYRPISILSHIAKVFERLVHIRLSSF